MQLAFRTILVATDFGPAAQLALEYASVLARRFDASMRVLYVAEPPMAFGSELAGAPATFDNERAIEEGQRRMTATLALLDRGDVIGQVLVGRPAEKIVEYADDHDVDLIVMGTHGRRALAHLIMGSVAERVVRTATCPVFTIRDSATIRDVVEEAHEAELAQA
jgi:nucleotide-binding universal stress UspA family protein